MRDDDLWYLREANNVRATSPDPSSQIGVCIKTYGRNLGGIVLATNKFPEGVTPRLERPEKYTFIEHAERNAIYSAAKWGVQLQGGTLYMVGMGPPTYPCAECARAIVQAGIVRVVASGYKPLPEHWVESLENARVILEEGKVEFEEVDYALLIEYIGEGAVQAARS